MKTKATTHATPNLRTIGYLKPTTQRNQRRPWLSSEDRFTLAAMLLAVLLSGLVIILES